MCPCNKPWRPIRLWDVEAPKFSKQSANRWRWDCQSYAPAALCPPGIFVVLFSVTKMSTPQGHSAAGKINSIEQENPMTTSEMELATFRIVAVPQPISLPCAPLNNRNGLGSFGNFVVMVCTVCYLLRKESHLCKLSLLPVAPAHFAYVIIT
jgi:hypothetical protein